MGNSQNQLERIEDLLTQLIKNVANIRVEMTEMRAEMTEIRTEMTEQFGKVNQRLDYQREHVGRMEEDLWVLKKQ